MSKTLETLLKISKKKLDDQTQILSDLNQKKSDINDEKARLKETSAKEIDASGHDIMLFDLAHNYAQRASAAQLYLDDQLIKLEELITVEKNILTEKFLDKKRQEVLLEKFQAKKKAELAKKVQNQLDDFNAISFINKSN